VTATAGAVLNVARSQLGFVEGPNNDNPYGPALGYANHGAYCDQGVSWCAWKAHAQDIIGKFQNCAAHYDWFRARHETNRSPSVGAVVFFDWSGRRSYPEHVGFVEKVLADGNIQTLEFNTSDPNSSRDAHVEGVFRRVRSPQWVVAYAHPNYGTPISVSEPDVSRPGRTIPLVVDGAFGPKTKSRLQEFLHVTVDGIVGPVTSRALQRWVGCTQDGQIGRITIGHLQDKLHVQRDGIWGPVTTRALQRFLNSVL
jgi:surface antigen